MSPFAAAVLCSHEDRLNAWGRKLVSSFDDVYLISAPRRSQRLTASGIEPPTDSSGLPESVVAVFLHTGDRAYLAHCLLKVKPTKAKVFAFNLEGHPSTETDEFPIRRSTALSDFGITDSDARELADFALGRRAGLPSVCVGKRTREYLMAIAILCQGVLALHARNVAPPILKKGGDSEDGSHGSSDVHIEQILAVPPAQTMFPSMSDQRCMELQQEVTEPRWWSILAGDDIEKIAQSEWGEANPDEWAKVHALLTQVRLTAEIQPATVVQAYSALVKQLATAD